MTDGSEGTDGARERFEMMNWAPQSDGPDAMPVTVNAASRAAFLNEIGGMLARRQGFTVATLNLDHVVKLRRDLVFRAAYARHSHVVADGNPIIWLSRLSGHRVDLAPGSELIDPVAALAARAGVSAALVGSTPEVLDRAGAELEARHPGLRIAARISPAMGFDPEGPEADAAIEAIGASGAGLCLLALGAPRQEVFAVRAHSRLPETGFLSIGAGLDFIAGHQRRAPALARALAAEWLWRLGSDPRRLGGRYAACIGVLPSLVGAALRTRRPSA